MQYSLPRHPIDGFHALHRQGLNLSFYGQETEAAKEGTAAHALAEHKLKKALHIENEFRWGMKKYRKLYPNSSLPHITPHVCRHTFCTNMVNAGMDVKVLQYLKGHSEIDMTLNVYTHMGYEKAASQMIDLVDGKGTGKVRIKEA